jgi:F0F1-type ATP synthase delta subunit
LSLLTFFDIYRADRKIKHCRIKLEGRLYTIGNVEFESLVELINYYENHPLYRRVKLSYAISEDAVKRMTMVSLKKFIKTIWTIFLYILIARNRPHYLPKLVEKYINFKINTSLD